MDPWRQVCKAAGELAFNEMMEQSANAGVWFTQAQQHFAQIACLVAASQAARLLAESPDAESMLTFIREDNRTAGREPT
jgi:hypothetical protein